MIATTEKRSKFSHDGPTADGDDVGNDSQSDEPSNVALYFRDVRRNTPHKREQATAAAIEIEQLDLALWRCLLGYRPALSAVRAAIRAHLPALKEAGYQRCSRIEEHARRLRSADRDQEALEAADQAAARLPGKHGAFQAKRRAAVSARKQARDLFLGANLRLVAMAAAQGRYRDRGLEYDDLLQEGNLGLMQALNRYDPHKGIAFSTYSSWWIRHAITRAILNKGREIRLPCHWQAQMQSLARTHRELTIRLRRPPTLAEQADALGMTVDKVQDLLRGRAPLQLDQSYGDGVDETLSEVIADERLPDPDEAIDQERSQHQVHAMLSRLPPRLQHILRRRFGFDGDPDTLEVIGNETGHSRERIRQLERDGLVLLRGIAARAARWRR